MAMNKQPQSSNVKQYAVYKSTIQNGELKTDRVEGSLGFMQAVNRTIELSNENPDAVYSAFVDGLPILDTDLAEQILYEGAVCEGGCKSLCDFCTNFRRP